MVGNLLLTYIPTYQYMNIHPVIACEHRSAVHLPAKTTAYIKEDALQASIRTSELVAQLPNQKLEVQGRVKS